MGRTTALLLGQLDGVILVSYIQVSTRTCGRISSTRTELAIGYLLVKLFGGISIASKLLLILGKTLCSVLSFLEIWARCSKDLKNIDMVMHIGDICYANGYLLQWVQFTAQVDPIASTVPYMVASGNHERDWPGSGSFYGNIDSGSECGVPAQNMFYVPAENREQFWYFTDYGMFRYSVANTELDWRPGTEQYKFIEHCFSSVDRQKQPWLIFLVHLVLGYSSATFYGDSCNESCDLQASRV